MAIAAIIIGLAAAITAAMMPFKFPYAPDWTVRLGRWGGWALVVGGITYMLIKR